MTTPLSPVIIGGTDITTMQNAVDINKSTVTAPTHAARADRFWSSRSAFVDNPIKEVLEIDYASAGITNLISFDAIRFPHTIAVEYTSSTEENWTPVLDAVTRRPVHVDILGSYPPVLNDPSIVVGHFHPQHDYEGHWTRYDLTIAPITIQKLRFILQRGGGNGPVDVTGNAVPYSLALQNIDTGYRIQSEDDIPFHLPEEDSDTSGQVFANSADLFGSNLGFSKKTHKASNLALNTDSFAPLLWKSEPQPSPLAVINFYADLRDGSGEGQIIDQIFIDPLYLGCSMNLYYSNDATTGDSLSSRTVLTGSQSVLNGAHVTPNGLSLGTWHPVDGGNPAFFDPYSAQIDNFSLGFDPSLDWWVGIEWTRDWAADTDADDHDLFACDAFRVGQNQDSFYLATSVGDTITLDNFTVDNAPIQIVAAYKAGLLHLTVQQDGTVNTIELPASVRIPSVLPAQLVVGASLDQSVFAGGYVSSFILSQSFLIDDSYIDDPSAFSLVPLLPADESLGKYDALLRFDAGQAFITASTNFIGGPLHPYDAMTWTPIPRTYQMQRGYMKVPATKAKFWNLEISNLRPENVEKFVPVTRRVKFFPPELFDTKTPQTTATTRQTEDDLALNVLQTLSSNNFSDIPQYQGTGGDLSGISNTEVYVARDPDTAARLATTGSEWHYQQFHPDAYAPRFSKIGIHNYLIQTMTQTTNVSYFTGLRNIVFARISRTAPQNAPVIEESFLNGDGVASGNWITTSAGLYSGSETGPTFARSTSIVLPTQTGLRGLQFAAQQSDAQAIDIGGSFSDLNYDPARVSEWSNYGDGKVFGLDLNRATGRSALFVSRESDHGFWGDVSLNWGVTYSDLEGLSLTFGALGTGTSTTGSYGGVESQPIPAPIGGVLHAAVRATASQSLTAPLFVQIVDSDTGSVLAEAESNVSKNETKQWFASLDLADLGASVGQTWGELSGHQTWPSFADSFTRADATSLGRMDSGQSWTTPSGYSPFAITSNKAVAPANARSEIDTLTPWGTLSFRLSTVTTTGTHSSAVPVVDIGGIYLMNDGTFLDQNISSNWGTLGETLTTTHDYNFKFMLTSEVPGGEVPGGVDATIQPYSLVISTGTLGSDTWLKTISSSRAFTSLRALMGPTGTAYTKFNWTPTSEQVRVDNFVPHQVAVTSTDLTDNGYNIYTASRAGKIYTYRGQYTYDTNLLATRSISLRPSGSLVPAPSGLGGSAGASGGSFAAGTYYYKVTATNSFGETTGSNEVNFAVVPGGTVSLSWTASAGAVNYNIYRGTASGGESLIASSGSATSYTDFGDDANTLIVPPIYNTTNGAGIRMTTDVVDQYGSLRINVTQMPSNMAAADVILAYLDYNPAGGQVLTLHGDGSIHNEIAGTTLGTIAGFSATAGPLTIHYVNKALLSSTFKTAHPVANSTAILFFQNGTTYLGMYTAPLTWTSTVRGIGGANNGTSAGQYTIIEGFNWNPDGSGLVPNTVSPTWGSVDYQSTRTYADMSLTIPGTTQNLTLRVVQKGESNNSWFIQSAVFFWDPVVWEFSCDSGQTFWEASAVRNDPNGVLLFPIGLGAYNKLMWRITSYAGRVSVSHLAIRPWYVSQHGDVVPQPAHLPQGPNLIPSDYYAPIERDPRWMAWDKPVPHWWWDESLSR